MAKKTTRASRRTLQEERAIAERVAHTHLARALRDKLQAARDRDGGYDPSGKGRTLASLKDEAITLLRHMNVPIEVTLLFTELLRDVRQKRWPGNPKRITELTSIAQKQITLPISIQINSITLCDFTDGHITNLNEFDLS